MIPHQTVLGALKIAKRIDHPNGDISVKVSDIDGLIPDFPLEEVVLALLNLNGVKFTDAKLGGIIIPKRYFE